MSDYSMLTSPLVLRFQSKNFNPQSCLIIKGLSDSLFFQVYDKYSSFDLTSRKDYIKTCVKEVRYHLLCTVQSGQVNLEKFR